jgi:hypothetical protein
MSEINALGIVHGIHGVVKTKEARSLWISQFPTPTDTKGVRSFLATVQITRC